LDIIGFNYHRQWIKDVPKNFPGKPFMMTESVSALQTRGYYMMPSDSIFIAPKEWWLPYTDPSYMCSAYDNMHAPWSSTHEQTWDIVKHTPYCSGQFIWTGWDYIGEPTPYNYPARSSYFGIIDLAGFPKDVYYMYQSEWTSKPVLHLFPHWNWVEGQTIDMWCYYNNADEVELYINGKSQGVRRKKDDHQYHVMWRVQFEPGEVKVVARKNGAEVGSQVIKTAGAPDHIRLIADRKSLKADGRSMAFVTVEVVDKDGNLCPNADNQIFFDVKGAGIIAGVDNGCQTSLERFKANNRKAFFGKCLVVIQSTKNAGNVQLTAKSADLKSETLNLSNN
jgi:beta-galactosidase